MSISKEIEDLGLNSAITDLYTKIKKTGAKFDDKHQLTFDANDENGLLPEGVTLKKQREYDKHKSALVSATALFAEEKGLEYLKKNKDIDSVTVLGKYGNDKIEVNLKRTAEVRNVATGDVNTVYGAMGVKYRAYGSNGSSGSLKTIRQFTTKMAETMLK